METKNDSNLKNELKESLLINERNKNNTGKTKVIFTQDKNNIKNPEENVNSNSKINIKRKSVIFFITLIFTLYIILHCYFFYHMHDKNIIKTSKNKVRRLKVSTLEITLKLYYNESFINSSVLSSHFDRKLDTIYNNNYTMNTSLNNSNITDKDDIIKIIYDIEVNEIINLESLFLSSNIKGINISGKNFPSINSTRSMFEKAKYLSYVNFEGVDFSKVETMERMFFGCDNLLSINLSNLNMSNVKYTSEMFKSCSSLISVNFSNTKLNNLIQMDSMFYGCTRLSSLILFD